MSLSGTSRTIAPKSRTITLFTKLPEEQPLLFLDPHHFAYSIESGLTLDLRESPKFIVHPTSQSQREIFRQAQLSGDDREYARYIVHFSNGDSVSTPVVRGERSRIQIPVSHIKRLMKNISAGKYIGSNRKALLPHDIRLIELAHNHPRSYMFRVSSDSGEYWMGNMGFSFSDSLALTSDASIFSAAGLRDRVPFRITVINSRSQALEFDLGVY